MGAENETKFYPDAKQFQNVENYTVTYGGTTDTFTLDRPSTITITQAIPAGYDAGHTNAGNAMTYEPSRDWHDAGYATGWGPLIAALIFGAVLGYLFKAQRS